MGPEVSHGKVKVYAGVRAVTADQGCRFAVADQRVIFDPRCHRLHIRLTFSTHHPTRQCEQLLNPGCERVHSPPIGAPFSATERFIKKTAIVVTRITTANNQKQSKYASADACW